MNCKCLELKAWLEKEIKHLEEIKGKVSTGSRLSEVIDTKIFAYLIVLDGLS